MLVSEILAIKGKVLYTIAPNKPLAEAVSIMTEQDVGSLVVFEHGRMAESSPFARCSSAFMTPGVTGRTLPCPRR